MGGSYLSRSAAKTMISRFPLLAIHTAKEKKTITTATSLVVETDLGLPPDIPLIPSKN
jgi:hypothetical protein